MAQHITGALEDAEEQWRLNSPECKQKLIKWNTWKAQSIQRARRDQGKEKQKGRRR